jgi:hypothetical protein
MSLMMTLSLIHLSGQLTDALTYRNIAMVVVHANYVVGVLFFDRQLRQ